MWENERKGMKMEMKGEKGIKETDVEGKRSKSTGEKCEERGEKGNKRKEGKK